MVAGARGATWALSRSCHDAVATLASGDCVATLITEVTMQLIVPFLYLVALAMTLTYAVGGVGLVAAIVLGLGIILAIEVALFLRDRERRASAGLGHHSAH